MTRWNLKSATALSVALVISLAACGMSESNPGRSAAPASDTTIPITRPLTLTPMDEPLVVEFDVPVNGPNASPHLAIDLIVRESVSLGLDALGSMSLIQDAGLSAEVALQRVDGAAIAPVELQYRVFPGRDPAQALTIPVQGRVPYVVRDTVDSTTLFDAEIIHEGEKWRTLAFAWAQNITPGTYRLSIRLIDTPETLSEINAHLLLAFQKKPK